MPVAGRRNERSRAAVLAATTAAVAESGYAGTSIEGIARRAGVGKQTIYRWWPSKAHVVLEAMLESAPADAPLPDSGDFAADLRELLRETVAELRTAAGTLQALLVEMQTDAELAEAIRTRLLQPQLAAVADRVRAGQQAGQVGEVEPQVAVTLMLGPLYHRWMLQTGPLDDDFADAVTDLVLRGLAAPHRS